MMLILLQQFLSTIIFAKLLQGIKKEQSDVLMSGLHCEMQSRSTSFCEKRNLLLNEFFRVKSVHFLKKVQITIVTSIMNETGVREFLLEG